MIAALLTALSAVKSFLAPLLKALADWRVLAAIAAVLALLWGLHETRRADGLQAALAAEKTAFTQEHVAFLAEQARSRAVEAARGQEHTSAVQQASDQERACSARVATARKSATVIHQILTEPAHANPDPSEPELLTAGQLRSAQGR